MRFDAHGVDELTPLKIPTGGSIEPNTIGHAGSGHGIGQFLQRTNHAPKKIYLRAKLEVCASDLEFLGIDPHRAGDSVHQPINNRVYWRFRSFRSEGDFISGSIIDRFLAYEFEIEPGDYFGRQK